MSKLLKHAVALRSGWMLLLSLLLLYAVSGPTARSNEEGVLVFAGGGEITEADLEQFVQGFYLTDEGRRQWSYLPLSERRNVQAHALQTLIERKVLLSEARALFGGKRQISAHVDMMVNRMLSEKEKKSGSRMELIRDMHENGLTLNAWKEFQREGVIIQTYLQERMGEIHIRPAEMREYYHENRSDFRVDGEAHIRLLHIAPETADSANDMQERVGRVHGMLQRGFRFKDLVQNYCAHYDPQQEGLHVVEIPEDDPERRPALVKGLEPGQVGDPVRRGEGYVIAKLEKIIPPGVKEFGEVQNEIRHRLMEKAMMERQGEILDRLLEGADIQFTQKGRELIGEEDNFFRR